MKNTFGTRSDAVVFGSSILLAYLFNVLAFMFQNKDRVIDLGVSLVSIGFGNLIETPIGKKHKDYKYYKQLLLAKETALRKKMGYRYYVKPTKLVLVAIYHQLSVLVNSILNRIVKKPTVTKALPAA